MIDRAFLAAIVKKVNDSVPSRDVLKQRKAEYQRALRHRPIGVDEMTWKMSLPRGPDQEKMFRDMALDNALDLGYLFVELAERKRLPPHVIAELLEDVRAGVRPVMKLGVRKNGKPFIEFEPEFTRIDACGEKGVIGDE